MKSDDDEDNIGDGGIVNRRVREGWTVEAGENKVSSAC